MKRRPESEWGRAVLERVLENGATYYMNTADPEARAVIVVLLDEVASLRDRLARFESDGR